MSALLRLYQEADRKGIEVYYYPMRALTAISTPDRFVAIDVDKLDTTQQETVVLGHEMGHCETGCFYTVDTPLAVRRRCEERAERWAIKRLVPISELKQALGLGITAPHELAEYFDVTQPFIEKSIAYYRQAIGQL